MRKIAIMMRIRLDGEALNNEGSVGNVMRPRTIELMDGVRNAISGDMLKHLHSRNLMLLADEDELCDTCKIFSPMRNAKVEEDKALSQSGNRVKACIIDDVHGFMNAGKGRNEKRGSVIKFSWAVGSPYGVAQTVIHSRVDNTDKNNTKKTDDTISDANTIAEQSTQMIMHKPLRSDEYAITMQIDLDRVGFDDEKLRYAVDEKSVKIRQRKVINALKNMFLDMEGAMCSTRLPHIMNIEGILVDKQNKDEVLVKYSALNDDYQDVNEEIANESYRFNNISEFVSVLDSLKI